MNELIWSFRLFISLLCGGSIGYERSRQFKSAGLRTHIVVAVGSALITIISKYGFYDILSTHNMALDPSRIAAQIVSGIGFIGAGMILTSKTKVSGLTTAAGIWATAAIGMAEGAGLYWIGIIATAMIVIIQYMFHDDSISDFLIHHINIKIQITATNSDKSLKTIRNILDNNHVDKPETQVDAIDEHNIYLNALGQMNNRKTSVSNIIMDLNKSGVVKQARFSRR